MDAVNPLQTQQKNQNVNVTQSRISKLANLPSRQTFSGFSSLYTHDRGHDVPRVRLDQFKRTDSGTLWQRLILYQLVRQKVDLTNKKLVLDSSPKADLKWAKTKDRLATLDDSYSAGKKGYQKYPRFREEEIRVGNVDNQLNSIVNVNSTAVPSNQQILLFPKVKRSSRWSEFLYPGRTSKSKPTDTHSHMSWTLHLIKLAIRDMNQAFACKLMHTLNMKLIIKKYPLMLNYLFLIALNTGMDSLAILMMEENFPKSVNDPILAPLSMMQINDGKIGGRSYSGRFFPPSFINHEGLMNFSASISNSTTIEHYPSYFLTAIAVGSETIVKYMVKRGAQLNLSWFGLSPLHLACCLHEKGNAQLLKFLLDSNADPTLYLLYQQYFLLMQLKTTYKPLTSAALHTTPTKKRPVVADLSSIRNSWTSPKKAAMHLRIPTIPPDQQAIQAAHSAPIFPIEIAASVYNLEAVVLLLTKLESTTNNLLSRFRYPLIIQQDVDISIRLIKAGANVNQRTIYGSTPLHLAARVGNIELIAVYLYFGLQIDIDDDEGWTPLHEAAFFGQHSAVKYLIRQGANPQIKNSSGDTPMQVALKSGFASEELLGFFERQTSDDLNEDGGIIEQPVDIEQLIAEIGDLRLGDANLKKKSRFFNFKSTKSRFTIEKLNDTVAAAILPLERIHSRSPKTSASTTNSASTSIASLEGGTIGLRRSRTMSSGDTHSPWLFGKGSSGGFADNGLLLLQDGVPNQHPTSDSDVTSMVRTKRSGHSHSKSWAMPLSSSSLNSDHPQYIPTSPLERNKKWSSTEFLIKSPDLSPNDNNLTGEHASKTTSPNIASSHPIPITHRSPSTTPSSPLSNSPSSCIANNSSSGGLSRKTGSMSFTSMSTLYKLFSTGNNTKNNNSGSFKSNSRN
jgi:ankyrin repeat protein